MIFPLGHVYTLFTGRDGRWPAVRRSWLILNPCCAVCGTLDDIEVHHLIPVSWNDKLELVTSNLITLCRPHHYTFGHLCDWDSYNPHCVEDCKVWHDKILHRPTGIIAA